MVLFGKSRHKKNRGSDTLLSNFSAKSRYAESYRTLRTNLNFAAMDKELSSIVVTSSVSLEGKTNTAANLANTIAQTGKRVLMVDADLRKPGLTERFSARKATGLSNLIGDMLGRSISEGKLLDFGLRDLIVLIGLQKRTCKATIENGRNFIELIFLKGELVDVYWKNRPQEKKLENTLVAENLLTQAEIDLVLGSQEKSTRSLGNTLLKLNMVAEKDLQRILSVHMMESFRVAEGMSDGTFRVESVPEDSINAFFSEKQAFSQLLDEMFSRDQKYSYIQREIDKSIVQMEEENLFMLPAGSIPANPSELLGSERASFLLEQLKSRFDFTIIDTSPLAPASDALLLGAQADGVLLVVKAGHTNTKLVEHTVQQLNFAKINILGVVLNQSDVRKDTYYKYYQSYYGE